MTSNHIQEALALLIADTEALTPALPDNRLVNLVHRTQLLLREVLNQKEVS